VSKTIDNNTIRQCKHKKPEAQKEIYNALAPSMLGVCMRYLKDRAAAEDIMQDAFVTVFTKIDQYTGVGAFEGWVRKIMVNSALIYLRKNKNFDIDFEKVNETEFLDDNEVSEIDYKDPKSLIENAEFSKSEIMEAVAKLPRGFGEIFNLYAVEGFKHHEIAQMLNISEGTSKSQLMRARVKLQNILYKSAIEKHKEKRKEIF